MPAQEVELWLRGGQYCQVAAVELRPAAHPILPQVPLSISRGQAEAFYFIASNNGQWIIKKFHPGRSPDVAYLQIVAQVVPNQAPFVCGAARRVLSASDLTSRGPAGLDRWLAGSVLMPRIQGVDWSALTDRLHEGDLVLSAETRARLCRNLAQAVAELERHECAHRDLSSGNVYIDHANWDVSLIDWDSLYHPRLTMPANTTGGTAGYIAPFVWVGQGVDAAATWVEYADRFSLAICCVEFLVVTRGTVLANDGGMFRQDELVQRAGPAINHTRSVLRRDFPIAAPLFDQAIGATCYADCPSPDDWITFTNSILGVDAVAPKLDDALPWSDADFLAALNRISPPPPVWPVPPIPAAPDFSTILAEVAAAATLPPGSIPSAPAAPDFSAILAPAQNTPPPPAVSTPPSLPPSVELTGSSPARKLTVPEDPWAKKPS